MGRRKANKPKRARGQRPLAMWTDELQHFSIEPPITLEPGVHHIAMTTEGNRTRTTIDGVTVYDGDTKVVVEDGQTRMAAADPITRRELVELLGRVRKKGWVIPRDEEVEPFLDRLVSLGLMEHDANANTPHPIVTATTGYRVTVAGWSFLRRLLRCKTEADLPPPLAPDLGSDWSDAEAEMVLCTWALADMFCVDDPETAARFRAEAARERLNLLFPEVVRDD